MLTALLSGCALQTSTPNFFDATADDIPAIAMPQEIGPNCAIDDIPPAPHVHAGQYEFQDVALQEAIRIALTNSTVFHDLGGTLVRAPEAVDTIYEPSLQDTNPQTGVEAALSAFDATFTTSVFAEKNDRALNNLLTGGGTFELTQDLILWQSRISKVSAAGTEISITNNTEYDANNRTANRFPSAWDVNYEFEIRQPLLQGAGVNFNRIAGPATRAGIGNGVLVARVNTDISVAEFELGLRNLVSNVENAYWDLYFAYRRWNAQTHSREANLEIWRRINANLGRQGFESDREAQAREQYYRAVQEAEEALTGRIQAGTSTNNGAAGGVFRGNLGVLVAERRLRLILGLPVNGAQLIRPSSEPPKHRFIVDWPSSVTEAGTRRGELRRQQQIVRLQQLQLTASRNLLLPRLDSVIRYRPRGFGDDLLSTGRDPDNRFDNAYQNLTSGDFQEWLFGLEFSVPIGLRREYSRLRHFQLQLAREQAVFAEQRRQIIHDLSNAVGDLERAWNNLGSSYNRAVAAAYNVEVLRDRFAQGRQINLDQLLDAERRFTDADIEFHRATVEYAMAVKNVHFEKGSLLDYGRIELAEGPWPGQQEAVSSIAKLGDKSMTYVFGPLKQKIAAHLGFGQPTLAAEQPAAETPAIANPDQALAAFADEPSPTPASPTPQSDHVEQEELSQTVNRDELTDGTKVAAESAPPDLNADQPAESTARTLSTTTVQ